MRYLAPGGASPDLPKLLELQGGGVSTVSVSSSRASLTASSSSPSCPLGPPRRITLGTFSCTPLSRGQLCASIALNRCLILSGEIPDEVDVVDVAFPDTFSSVAETLLFDRVCKGKLFLQVLSYVS